MFIAKKPSRIGSSLKRINTRECLLGFPHVALLVAFFTNKITRMLYWPHKYALLKYIPHTYHANKVGGKHGSIAFPPTCHHTCSTHKSSLKKPGHAHTTLAQACPSIPMCYPLVIVSCNCAFLHQRLYTYYLYRIYCNIMVWAASGAKKGAKW